MKKRKYKQLVKRYKMLRKANLKSQRKHKRPAHIPPGASWSTAESDKMSDELSAIFEAVYHAGGRKKARRFIEDVGAAGG